jgi:hypothetical protein
VLLHGDKARSGTLRAALSARLGPLLVRPSGRRSKVGAAAGVGELGNAHSSGYLSRAPAARSDLAVCGARGELGGGGSPRPPPASGRRGLMSGRFSRLPCEPGAAVLLGPAHPSRPLGLGACRPDFSLFFHFFRYSSVTLGAS